MSNFRHDIFNEIASKRNYQAIVIGGGINGISAYRELANAGVDVLLVERGDFCGGCSAAPSRMIHGGLRYLENGEFTLVKESLGERDALLKNAPHFVKPLPTSVPINSVFSGIFNGVLRFFRMTNKSSNRGAIIINLGLTFYDFFTRKSPSMPKHSFNWRSKTSKRWPSFNKNIKYTAVYHDAWISHPERLGLELIKEVADLSKNSIAVNYATLRRADDNAYILYDEISKKEVTVHADILVNATGAWLDVTNETLLGKENSTRPLVGGTKGSHLILSHKALFDELDGHMVYFENKDGRVCIMFPYLGKVLVGSTDLKVNKPIDVKCEDSEKQYILESLKFVFPSFEIADKDIVYTYSGVRPLPQSDDSNTAAISRDHFVKRLDGKPTIFCMIGGKWTTFRAFGEQLCDAVLAETGRTRTHDSVQMSIGGGQHYPTSEQKKTEFLKKVSEDFNVEYTRALAMFERYGTKITDVLIFCNLVPDVPMESLANYSQREIIYLIEHEYVEKLTDILLRRTSISIKGEISNRVIDEVLSLLQKEKNWNDERASIERDEFKAHLLNFHQVNDETLTNRDNQGE